MRACLSVDEIALYIGSAATFDGLAALEAHVDACDSCRTEIATAVRAGRVTATGDATGTTIGRYVVRDVIGTGAMGHVYEAFDPELDRIVALKVIRSDDPAADELALREGRALARLSHPNVVAIYDVGVWEGRVFIAMERVEGQSVRAWLTTTPHWRAIVEAFVGAARGLAAAHRNGVIHRDIKPDNLVIDHDQRMRVIDFGLAMLDDNPELLAGTPAYMAPEQLAGKAATTASDQYAFVVSLIEAVAGRRPDDSLRLRGWLRAIMRRGLDARPERRFPDMGAVARALERGVARRRRFVVGSAIAIAVAIAAWAATIQIRGAAPEPCGGDTRRDAVWNDQRRQVVHAAFAATHKPFAEAAFQQTSSALEAYTRSWQVMFDGSCEATRRGEQSPSLLDLRAACLDQRMTEVDALVSVFETADATAVQRAVVAVQGLPSLASCADTVALTAAMPPPPAEIRAEVDRVSARQLRVSALRLAGHRKDEVALVKEVVDEARKLGYPPLLARAIEEAGLARTEADDDAGAEALYRESVEVAERSRADVTKAESEILLVGALDNQRKFTDAEQWAHLADATLRRLGDQHRLEARLAAAQGEIAHGQRHIDVAIAHYERARALFARLADNPPLLEAATLEQDLGRAYELAGNFAGAEDAFGRAVAIVQKAAGNDHPDLALALSNQAIGEINHGRYDKAFELYQKAAKILEAALGETSDLAEMLASSGSMLEQLGRFDEALAMKQRAYAIDVKALGAGAEKTLAVELQLGVGLYYKPAPADALAHFLHVVDGDRRLYGPDHAVVAQAEIWQALALRELGRDRETVPLLEHAVAIQEHTFGHDNPMIVPAIEALGVTYHRLHDRKRAVEMLERAVALARVGPEPAYVAKIQKLLEEARK